MTHPLLSSDLTTSSRFAPDSGEILLKFFEDEAKKINEENLKKEIAMKRKLIECYQKRVDVLTHEILKKSGEKMMTLEDINAAVPMAIERKDPQDLTGFLHQEELEIFKICHGVTICDRTSSSISFQFVAIERGQLLPDSYLVKLSRPDSGKLELLSAIMPKPQSLDPIEYTTFDKKKSLVLPLQKLANEHLPKIDMFVKSVQEHLNAYLSRFDQLASIPDEFSEDEVFDIGYNHDLTSIKFALTINDNDADSGGLIMHVKLYYDSNGIRPRKESMMIKLSGPGKLALDELATQALQSQCQIFYSHPICAAIKHGFK